MKIRTKNGRVLDLKHARELQRMQGRIHPEHAEALLDALEAALSVPCPTEYQHFAALQFDQRAADCIRAQREIWFAVRQAAGVIEEGGT